jgi:hypothetical protein
MKGAVPASAVAAPAVAALAEGGSSNALLIGGAILIIIIVIIVIVYFLWSNSNKTSAVGTSPTNLSVDCVVSNWTNQGSCSKFCGPGEQTQTRTVTTPASNGGAACPSLTRTVPCNLRECNNVDCEVSEWSAYDPSVCTSTNKSKTHTRTITTAKVDYGKDCPPLSEKQDCTSPEVDAVCNFTLSTTPNLSRCKINASGAVSGKKSFSYTSTVSGCRKPDVVSPCTSADVSGSPASPATRGGGQGGGGHGV